MKKVNGGEYMGFSHELIFSTFDERQIKDAFAKYRKGE